MNKILLTILCFCFVGCAHAGGNLLNVEKQENSLLKTNEMNAVKAQDISLLKAGQDINALKTQLGNVSGDISAVKTSIGKLADIQVKINNKLDANIQGIAGFNNTLQSIKSGRDNIQNDTRLMKLIINELSGLCALLIASIFGLIRFVLKLTLQKKFYEDRVMLSIQTPKDLVALKQEHDYFVKRRWKDEKSNS